MRIIVSFFLLVNLLFSSCNQGNTPTDNPTSGHIRISVDETFSPVLEAEIAVFHSLYSFAVINPSYVPEAQAVKDLLADSTKLIAISRELYADESKYFEEKKIDVQIHLSTFDNTLQLQVSNLEEAIVAVEKLTFADSGPSQVDGFPAIVAASQIQTLPEAQKIMLILKDRNVVV